MASGILLIPEIPPELRAAAQIGKLVPFIGSGVSVLAGCPEWRKLAAQALLPFVTASKLSFSKYEQLTKVHVLPDGAKVPAIHPRVQLSIALGLQNATGIAIPFKQILHSGEGLKNPEGRKIYSDVCKLAHAHVTTNYDMWPDYKFVVPELAVGPDTGMGEADKAPAVDEERICIYDRTKFLPASLVAGSVLHLHGSVRDPKTMVLAQRDYLMLYANDRNFKEPDEENLVLTFLHHLFQRKTVLFMGYGAEEMETLEYVISKSRYVQGAKPEEKHYMLQGFGPEEVDRFEVLRDYYAELGIVVLPFLVDKRGIGWKQLAVVIEYYAKEMPASTPMVAQGLKDMESFLART